MAERNSTGYEDEDVQLRIKELSPNVTPFRKGKGPKRSRCASYYDSDLLSPPFSRAPGSRKGKEREVLAERSASASITEELDMDRIEDEEAEH